MSDNGTLTPLKQAFFALQQANARITELEARRNEPIAIVGLGCRFPGHVSNAEAYWHFLSHQSSAVGSDLAARWRQCGAGETVQEASLNRGALVDDPSVFDPLFFGISPREASYIDPQHRLLLEVSWEALEDAGIAPGATFSTRTGVYVGIAAGDYGQLELANGGLSAINPHYASGSAHSVASGRLSYTLGLRGPSLSIDTACSSSLVAVHQACAGLRSGDCDLALAGGVNLILTPESSIAFSRSGMLSSSGVVASFSSSADGFVRGEGCGVVVLKRLRDAEASGDRILGVIRGSAVNHDGPTSGLTVPSGQAQQLLLRAAFASAGLSPSAIGYVEAHGTGTRLGDPIEAEALGAVFAGERAHPLAIGSVKTNLGHLEAAAGMAGLIKLLLALEHREIPPQLHFDEPSPLIRWSELPLEVVTRQRPWEPIDGRRIGGVSAFGFSGTNAHVIVEEAPARARPERGEPREAEVLAISAKTEAALARMVTRYRRYLESHPGVRWEDVCHTAAVGRSHFRHRIAVVAPNTAAAIELLRAYERGEARAGVVRQGQGESSLQQATAAPLKSGALSAAQLAEAYEAGAEVDWAAWDRDQVRERIRLPGYSFERQRHWFPAASIKKPVAAGMATGHPLLGARLRSAAAAVQYEQTLSLTGELAWLADHRIGGRVLMPATAYAELLLAAADRLPGHGAARVEELMLSRPLELDGECLLQVIVEPVEASLEIRSGSHRVRVYSGAGTGHADQPAWVLHAEGTVRRQEPGSAATAPALEAIRLRCTDVLDAAAFYRTLQARGADFGPRFRQVRTIWRNSDEALGEVLLERLGERLHPASLDACLQVAAALLQPGQSDEDNQLAGYSHAGSQLASDSQTLLPLSLDALTFRSPNLPQQALVYVTRITAPDIGAPSVSASGKAPAALRKLRLQLFAPDHTPITNLITLAFAHTKIQSKEETSDWMYEVSWRKAPLPPRTQHASLNWTLVLQGFTPNDPSVRRISQALQAHGQQVTMVALGEDSEALKRILAERVQRVLYLHQPMQLNGEEGAGCTQVAFPAIEGLLQLTRALIGSNLAGDFRLTVITQTSHSASQEQESVNPLEALISGIAATILAEHPSSRCKRLDVDSDAMRLRTDVIVAELLQDDREDWVSLRGNNRYVPRLQRSARPDPVAPLALTFSRGTGLSSLRYEPMQRRVLRAREIEIEVRAAALNFHDVLSAIDLLPDKDPLGAECSGVVRRTGPEVTKFSEGDEVLAIAPGCFGTYAIAEEALVCHKPASLSFEHAASLPIAYLTSDYCLHSVARLSAGQRVLVHAASGGVGLAAVHLCLRAGAELYVTAGSDRKREYLRSLGVHHVMDSRSEQFAEQIRSLTKGHGVDVVLNSLAGKLTDAGLSITANPGVFIDIGRTDVREPRQVAADYPGLAYQAVDLTQQLVNDADSMGERLRAIVDDIAREKLPALPVEEFAWDDAPNAFRHMAAARHIGKIVLSRVSPSQPALKTNPGSSYIVTGGLTGLGLEAVDWLASKKAGKVVIVARRPPGEATAHRIDQLRGNGVQIVVLGGDVAETETIQRAIEESGDSLRGILHCAGAVDDAPIERQSRLSFAHTLDGKANGAWLLHQATRSLTLDFFVLHSSWATIAGSAHAANYCAANMFLDALASYRRSLGLVATSLSWGPWKNLGMSANRNDRHFMRRGFLPLTAEEGKRALEHAVLRQSRAHIALARVDWQTFAEAARREPVSLVYADLLPHALPEGTKNTALTPHKDTLLEELRSAPVHAQLALLKRRVDDVLATVLGLSSCDEVDADQPLEAMGMDSILSIEVKNALTSQFGENLPMTLLFDYPTARALTRYLAERFDLEGKQQSKDQAKSMLDELETMSDDEVEKVLTALE